MVYYAWDSQVEIEELVGKTFTTVSTDDPHSKIHLLLLENENEGYAFVHFQDCCEYVYFESCDNDLQLLVGQEILEVSERTEEGRDEDGYRSYTWTFYHIRTARDTFVIRFNGESNGYYSEHVDLIDLKYQEKQDKLRKACFGCGGKGYNEYTGQNCPICDGTGVFDVSEG